MHQEREQDSVILASLVIDGKIKYVNRSRVDGSLNDNIKELEGRASSANFHIRAVIAVGRFIAFHGPIVKTQDALKYISKKKCWNPKKTPLNSMRCCANITTFRRSTCLTKLSLCKFGWSGSRVLS